MAPYFEIQSKIREGVPEIGYSLPKAAEVRRLRQGEIVTLMDPKSNSFKDGVYVYILPDNEVKVLILTPRKDRQPEKIEGNFDNRNVVWVGGISIKSHNTKNIRQRIFWFKEKTIITHRLKRVEWRP